MSTPRANPKYYLTTPLYYTNGLPHIGHTYSTIVADVIRRYKRMRGFDAFMTTGADEHGVNVERSAQKAGKSPQEFSTEISVQWRRLWDELGIPGDEFIRTTDEKHHRTVQWLFKRCRDNGFIVKGHYTGQYCVHDNAYVVDAGPGDACPDCGRPTETVTEENYFFKLSEFQQQLLDFYAANPDFIQPESRRNEVLSFVNGGLKNLSITRTTIRWGIPVPGEAPHVFYVWFDALIGYLSAVGGPNYDQRGLWPADLHLVGKEIIRFHAVYWPAFLMAADLPLPRQIWAHGWLLFDSEKMSKSRGNVVRPQPIVNAIGIEPLRYYLLREIVFGQDGSFSYDALITRYNSDLANGLGNLASRTLTMIERYFGGEIPKPAPKQGGETDAPSTAEFANEALTKVMHLYDRFNFSMALESVWEIVGMVDKYITVEKPWTLAEKPEDRARLATVLYTAAEALRIVTALAHPVLPQATQKIWSQLGQTEPLSGFQLDLLLWGQLKPGTKTGKPEGIFPRLEKSETIARIEAMEQEQNKPPAPPSPATAGVPAGPGAAAAPAVAATAKIGIEDFAKVEMRVGQVKTAERVAGADRLLQLQVDIGDEVRQIVAGLALAYKPEELVGRKVVVVTNLQPRKLRGVESNGMIVAASLPDGSPVLAGFLEDVPVGAKLK
ncbi:MAG TPA: methionine--tRNA ligase [Candidatus Acidoferrum sp.]|jgi:methionyl-tRNA synthetase|nr:methionine--tRNA ligase [Candidatus Acidoferrum sp.]